MPEPGSFIRREIEFASASVLIVRGKDGEVRAFHNVCTHRGTQLVDEAAGRRSTFSCPYHQWTFGSDGKLLAAPDFERFYMRKEDCSLKQVAVDVCAGLIFLCFDPQQSLRDFLGPLFGRLEQLPVARATAFHEYEFDIAANWKLIYDNFQEAYHLRFIHPETSSANTGGSNPFGYPANFTLHQQHRSQTVWHEPDAQHPDTLLLAFARSAPRMERDGVLGHPDSLEFFGIFPSMFLMESPGNPFNLVVYPIGPERSRGVVRNYGIGEDETASVRFARELAMAINRDLFSEDLGPMEAGQRGISSGALAHVHFQEKEVLCRQLAVTLQNAVEAYREQLGLPRFG